VKILFDTNVILDVMLLRNPFYKAATLLLAEVEDKNLEGYICSTTATIIFYLVSKVKGSSEATQLLKALLQIFNVSQVDKITLETAINSDFSDYEDSVLHESAIRAGVNGIVTRNRKDFINSKITIYDPEELLKIIH
jgi:predicted nucleic acid-binding protein